MVTICRKGEILMKKSFIFLSIFIITFIAFFDAKDRFRELDEVAANTPSQVEMNQMINKPDKQINKDNIQNQQNVQTLKQKTDQDNSAIKRNQLNNVDKLRDTIKNQID